MLPVSSVTHHALQPALIEQVKQPGFFGFILSLFGQSFEVFDENKKQAFYVSKSGLVKLVTAGQGSELQNTAMKSDRVKDRVLEVLNPVLNKTIRLSKIQETAKKIGSKPSSSEQLIAKLEEIRDRHLPKLNLNDPKLKDVLKPGDIIFKKYHEDNPSIICKMQKLFKAIIVGKKEREGHKFAHAAMYVGNGEVAEAVTPHGKDPQVRVLRLDDPRFALIAKNEYRIVCPSDEQLGAKAALVFRSFSRSIQPSTEPKTTRIKALKYNFIEAARSLWHPSNFDYFARQRYLKYHADYADGATPTQIIMPRRLFCSYAVSLAYQVADGLTVREKGPKTLEAIVGTPPTRIGNPIIRTIVRAIWSRYHAIVNRKAINNFVKVKYDAVRANPQDMRNFIIRHPQLFCDHMIVR
ncbi:MAG: hypothetical protein LLG04_03830 [Parachlamydia sp.]|nr:hypothetical protein [Parachlamydia sp.]